MRGQKETRACANCGKTLTRLVSQAKGKYWYCDHSCQAAHAPSPVTISRNPNPNRGRKETRQCVNCGEQVTRYLSQAKIDRPWFCSMNCRASYQSRERIENGTWHQPVKPRKGDTILCAECGRSFYRSPREIKRDRRICSVPCANAAQRKTPVVKQCAYCGRWMELKPSQAEAQYCSNYCKGRGMATLNATGREHNGKDVRRTKDGYLLVWDPEHPGGWSGWHLEHRYVVEKMLGRKLNRDEQVHHVDHDKENNDPANLSILAASPHGTETAMAMWDKVRSDRMRLTEYERLYGPLATTITQ